MKSKYVIRSMSTTDFRPGQKVEPYHIYLLSPQDRAGAYWSSFGRAMTFDTPQEAEAELKRSIPSDDRSQVALADGSMPSFWELRR